jgi:hypothetical protein
MGCKMRSEECKLSNLSKQEPLSSRESRKPPTNFFTLYVDLQNSFVDVFDTCESK